MNKIPLMKNCRSDYPSNGKFTVLVDYITGCIVYVKHGRHTLKNIYGEFKFCVKSELSISTYSFMPFHLPFVKIEGATYTDY